MSTESEFLEAYERIKLSYKAAMAQVEQAVSHEEAESEAALAAYAQALHMVEETFAIPVGLPDEIDVVQTQWNDACAIIQKLKSAKTEISYRLQVLRAKQSPIDESAMEAREPEVPDGQSPSKRPLLAENPNTFYDIANATGRPKTYKELAVGLRELLACHDAQAQLDELFQAQVKLYRIEAGGQVATLTGSTKMSLIMCTVGGKWKYLNGIYFIQCDMPQPEQSTEVGMPIWLYPLIPNVSNCYRTEYGAFILPDMESAQPGNAFGIMLERPQRPLSTSAGETEEEQMADLQQFFLDLLEAVLADTVEQLQSPRTRRAEAQLGQATSSEQVSKHIVCAADFIARNLVKGAEKTGGLMMRTTPYLISKMAPAAPDGQTQVPSSVQTGVDVAQRVTHAAAGMTGWIAGKVGTAAMAVGGYLAPQVQTQGSRLLQKGFGYDTSQANSAMEGALTIAAGAVEGFSTVFDGLETSAKILGNSLSENSVKIIEHKYGSSAGTLACGTFDTVGNAFIISQNVNIITPKGMAKKLVKKTGEAVVVEYKRDLRKPESQYISAGALYPDLRALKE
ncbi:protein spartin isoform X2 [Drosophila montana]